MSEIPEGQLSRAAVVGATAIKLGVGRLQKKALSTFGSTDAAEELDEKTAEQLFEALVKLRGTAIKLAQMLGMESGLLPDRLQKELSKSWHQVPPLNRVLVRKVMLEEFDCPPNEMFKAFEPAAFAAASLGQVHHARLADNTPVAVKIQYPGIHVAMQSDIKLLRKVVKGLPQRKIAEISVDEIEARLSEELDYSGEAERTEWFRQNMATAGVFVPKVFRDFSTARVLTSELMQGVHLDAWLQKNHDQDIRNAIAQRIYDCFIHCIKDLRQLHADPNPGNYLFRDDGTIAMIDFGCTRKLSDEFVDMLPELLKAYQTRDKERLRVTYANLGMHFTDKYDEVFEHTLIPFGDWLTQPFQTDYFDFGQHSDYTTGARELLHRMSRIKGQENIAKEFIFFDRTVYGLCKIFEKLQAKVRMRHHWGLE